LARYTLCDLGHQCVLYHFTIHILQLSLVNKKSGKASFYYTSHLLKFEWWMGTAESNVKVLVGRLSYHSNFLALFRNIPIRLMD